MASFRVDEVVRMVRVVFLHPDLGIGGAERLIVDCSLALQSKVEKSDECSNLFISKTFAHSVLPLLNNFNPRNP